MDRFPEDLSAEQLYQALASRDARFDGKFYVGVTSTGIYCRPICRVRLPRAENCRFFASAAQAEAAEFRPCLRCRPEQAPGWSTADAVDLLAEQAARLIDQGQAGSLAELADRLGTSDRHLRRLFKHRFGVSPGQYLRTRRLLLAKALLTDTRMPVLQVAELAGFGSASRFYDQFQSHYRLSPARLRRGAANGHYTGACSDAGLGSALRFRLGYRPPFDWDGLLDYFAGRTIDGVEAVIEGSYCRAVALIDRHGQTHEGWIRVRPASSGHAIELTLSESLAAVIPQCLARVRVLFDLDADPARINPVLGDLAEDRPGLRIPGAWDGFELACRAVLGQLVSVRAATTLSGRLAGLAGHAVTTPWDEVHRRFPLASDFGALDPEALGQSGITRRSAAALAIIASDLVNGKLDLAPRADPDAARETLMAIHGIGDWTFQYIALRALRWPDAFPAGDLGVRKALGADKPRDAEKAAERWRPWRGYAVLHLWRSLA
jgi:AraC family transcriptional regulator, regulatory protein of adaptative response / DNA-3-methyladenine glycosylase II